jgi:hypothetical protein
MKKHFGFSFLPANEMSGKLKGTLQLTWLATQRMKLPGLFSSDKDRINKII